MADDRRAHAVERAEKLAGVQGSGSFAFQRDGLCSTVNHGWMDLLRGSRARL